MADFDLIVVGAGPAGLAATAYALQSQLHVALVAPALGGKTSYPFELRGLPAVDGAWGGQLIQQLKAYVEAKLKSHFTQEVTQIARLAGDHFQLTLADGMILGTHALIFCTGAQAQRLHVPGELEFAGHGVSYSATSHAQFFRNRPVAVVGGERALTAALKLAAIASKVYYVQTSELPASAARLAEPVLRHAKVYLFRNWQVQRIVGDGYVTGVDVVNAAGESQQLGVQGVFIELGLLPSSGLVRNLLPLELSGHIAVDQRCASALPGFFAAGDVTNVYAEQVPVAIGEGIKATLSAWAYLATRR